MKIAFLFLMVNDHKRFDIWDQFFKSSTIPYSVYVNVKNRENVNSFFKNHIIENNFTDTTWGEITLVNAELELYKEALKDRLNTHFILISDSCIPLYNLNEFSEKVFENGDVVFDFQEQPVFPRMKKLKAPDIKKHLVKHHQWVHLTRPTVDIIVKNEKRLNEFNCLSCVDEKFIGTIMHINKIPYKRIMFTNVTWLPNMTHPKLWNHLSINDIKRMRNRGSILVRKINSSLQVNIEDLLNSFE